jgi:hypothetical protein
MGGISGILNFDAAIRRDYFRRRRFIAGGVTRRCAA